ncbi:hypothetical protein AAFF_G00301500 [Aldrovandia affinis]|uniref:Uncharacterized protein n=1 Tax=Aldrovandia affinis TaxID=143900 RepID=A0AAD7SQ35_9TELE|nr:hypothetical protein AAFF_G00301500 [Aldrovandia affinis]
MFTVKRHGITDRRRGLRDTVAWQQRRPGITTARPLLAKRWTPSGTLIRAQVLNRHCVSPDGRPLLMPAQKAPARRRTLH